MILKRQPLVLPEGATKILLHSCCAPCSGEVIEALMESGADFTVYFYNPNICPREEYDLRKSTNKRFAESKGIPFIDADYDPESWFARVRGLENEPERGKRCSICFLMRLERSARYAHEHGFPILTSCFGISRWKDMAQVNACGHRAASLYDDVSYWDYDWRKGGGSDRMNQIAERERFYRQKYCGCAYSLRDAQSRSPTKFS